MVILLGIYMHIMEPLFFKSMASTLNNCTKFILFLQGALINMLEKYYGDYKWDNALWSQSLVKHKSQSLLVRRLKSIFPNEEIIENFLHPTLKFQFSDKKMQLDIWMPHRNLAIEYNGAQHYVNNNLSTPHAQQVRDALKMQACMEEGIYKYISSIQ
jgi:hypothetical protein